MSPYKKEAVLTIGFFVLYLLMAHTAPWAIMLGIDNSVRMFGYPMHYLIAISLGWFGVLGVSIAWNHFADKLDDEITAAISDEEHVADAGPGMASSSALEQLKGEPQ